jgi:hypothetical protein
LPKFFRKKWRQNIIPNLWAPSRAHRQTGFPRKG